MFAKAGSSTVNHKGKKLKDVPLRKSDRRHFKERVWTTLQLAEDTPMPVLEALFAQGQLSSRALERPPYRLQLYFRSPGQPDDPWPYRQSEQCVWIEMEDADRVTHPIPTLALLSVMDPVFYERFRVQVPPEVSRFLCRGADLMRSGMRSRPESSTLGIVVAQGNPQALAVGWLTSDAAFGPGTKGIGMHIVTAYGDDLWCEQAKRLAEVGIVSDMGGAPYDAGHYGNVGFVGGQKVVPIVNQEEEVAEDDVAEEAPALADESGEAAPVETIEAFPEKPNNETTEEAPQALSPDQVLHAAVCRALARLRNKDLPMPVSVFYAQHVLPNRPPSTTVELKQTRYKKLSAYLEEQVSSGLLRVGPDPKAKAKDPLAILLEYNRKHKDLRPYLQQAKSEPTVDDTNKKLVLVDLYAIPKHIAELLRLDDDAVKAASATSEERRNTGLLTAKELRTILDDYIAREGLGSGRIILDGPLTDALFSKRQQAAEKPPETMLRKDVAEAWQARMDVAYALVETPGSRMVRLARGRPPKIEIEVQLRQSRKFVTHVRGVEAYDINPDDLASDIAHRFACASRVEEVHRSHNRKPCRELVLQGNLADELEALLTGDERLSSHGGVKHADYRLPKNAIEVVLRKGVPARKKRR